jgi:putative transposase
VSERRACHLLDVNRSSLQYQPRPDKNTLLREQLRAFAAKKRRRGAVKAHNWLRRQGMAVSVNRVHRLWKQERLQVTKRTSKKGRPPQAKPPSLVATHPGHVWSVDFIFDATAGGTKLKMLTVGDDFTRECLAIEVATSLPANKVIAVLARLFAQHGAPEYIRSDNGPEFIAHVLKAWLAAQQTQTHYIEKGSPWQNGFRESFHSRFRDEFLFGTLFASVAEARVLCEGFRREYNEERPHQALGYLTPTEFKAKWLQEQAKNLLAQSPTGRPPAGKDTGD